MKKNNVYLEKALLASLHGQIVNIVLGTSMVLAINVFTFSRLVSSHIVWKLSFVIFALLGLRVGNYFYYEHRKLHIENTTPWFVSYAVIVFMTGCAWGWFGYILAGLLSYNDMFVFYVSISGLLAGAVATASASPVIFCLFAVPIILPVTTLHFIEEGSNVYELIGLIVIYFVLIISVCFRIHIIIKSSIIFGQKNIELIDDLQKKQQEIITLNSKLAKTIGEQQKIMGHLEESTIKSKSRASELLIQSNTDALTGILNRRAFDELLSKEWTYALDMQKHLGIILLDIDGFKDYNDSLGHEAGDKCLAQMAKVLGKNLRRKNEVLFRYGGEEFAVLVPGKSLDESTVLADLIRRSVEDQKIPHPTNSSGVVTISAGVASVIPSDHMEMSNIFNMADKALYKAKNNGRNRVEFYIQDNK